MSEAATRFSRAGLLRFLACVLIVTGLAGLYALAGGERQSQGPRRVLAIGWDGTQRTRLHKLLAEGRLPNLRRLIDQGSLLDLSVVTGKTETKPGWAEILTGYPPDVTGVYSNRKRYCPIPEGYTIFERLEKHFGNAGIETLLIAGKEQNLGTRAQHRVWPRGGRKIWFDETKWGKEVFESEQILTFTGEPYMLASRHIDVFKNGLHEADRVGEQVLANLRRVANKRFFFFAHFEEPDEQGHVFGEGSREYAEALAGNDRWLGKILDLLRGLGIEKDTLVYVLGDHGFNDGQQNHKQAPDTFLATNDRQIVENQAERKDLAPTLLQRYGVELRSLAPPLPGKVLGARGELP